MWVLNNALCKPSLGAPGLVTKILQAKNGQKVDKFEAIYGISVITDIDENWFVIFEHTIHHLSFGYSCLPQLEYYFACFVSFFLLFLFLPILSTFKPLNTLYLNLERLNISERTFARQKSGVPRWGILLNGVFQNFELLSC